jgi:hypothetical protein
MKMPITLAVCALSLLAPSGCQKKRVAAEAAPSVSAAPMDSATAPGPASAPPPAAGARSPLAGTWSGSYRATPHRIEMDKKEALPAWAKDDQKAAVGEGKLELVIDPSGQVSGTSNGPIGELVATGRVEEGGVRATLVPRDPAAEGAFQGWLAAELAGNRIGGRIEVSSADGAVVRQASVDLGRRQ